MGWGPDVGALWLGRGMSVAKLETDSPPKYLGKGLMAPGRAGMEPLNP